MGKEIIGIRPTVTTNDGCVSPIKGNVRLWIFEDLRVNLLMGGGFLLGGTSFSMTRKW